MGPPAAADRSRNEGIDVLRGLSILLVVLHHLGLRIPLHHTALAAALPRWFLDGLNFNGYEAVFVFFVISGFLITDHSVRRWPSLARLDARAFYAMRFARIAPCLLTLVAILTLFHLLGLPDYVIHRDGQSLLGAIGAALGLYLNRYEGLTGYLPGGWDVLWSLSIEEVFYLLFPIAFLVTRRRWILVPLLALLAASLPWSHGALAGEEIWQEKAYLPGMAAIATGVLTALLCAQWQPSRRVGFVCLAGGALGLLTIWFAEGWLWQRVGEGSLLVLTLSVALLLIACDRWPTWRLKPLRALLAPVRSWGRLSYEIYLSHMFVVYGLVRIAQARATDPASGLWAYAVALPLCWGLGLAVERLLSTPCRRGLLARSVPRPSAFNSSEEGGP